MNANELADILENRCEEHQLNASYMLRQQQSEIEALKSVVYWLKENRPEVWDDIQKWRKAQSTCNGFCGEYECKENQDGCKRKVK